MIAALYINECCFSAAAAAQVEFVLKGRDSISAYGVNHRLTEINNMVMVIIWLCILWCLSRYTDYREKLKMLQCTFIISNAYAYV